MSATPVLFVAIHFAIIDRIVALIEDVLKELDDEVHIETFCFGTMQLMSRRRKVARCECGFMVDLTWRSICNAMAMRCSVFS
jgi:hypothetical protein